MLPFPTQFFRRHTLAAQCAEAQGVVTFSQAHAGLVCHQRAMVKGWRRQLESAVDQDLAGGREQEISAANDLCDLHRGVIDYDRKLIGRKAIMAPHYEVAEVTPGNKTLNAKRSIDKRNRLAIRDAKTPTRADIGIGPRTTATRARVNRFFISLMRSLQRLSDVFA